AGEVWAEPEAEPETEVSPLFGVAGCDGDWEAFGDWVAEGEVWAGDGEDDEACATASAEANKHTATTNTNLRIEIPPEDLGGISVPRTRLPSKRCWPGMRGGDAAVRQQRP
ncbi:MAG TPA: hypothetical protein VFP68_11635, partial [Burkholderiaceae bacterium]|nr:hypothetical protein [Burkholderiaceae bacterium]